MKAEMLGIFSDHFCSVHGTIGMYNGSRLLDEKMILLRLDETDHQEMETVFDNKKWKVCFKAEIAEGRRDAIDICLKYTLAEGHSPETCVGARIEFGEWSTENYVLMPAAVYNGNRFLVVEWLWSRCAVVGIP